MTAETVIGCYSLWMAPHVAAQRRPLSCRELKGAQQHYRGKLRKAQLHANVLRHNAYKSQSLSFSFPQRTEAWSCLLFRYAGGTGIASNADTGLQCRSILPTLAPLYWKSFNNTYHKVKKRQTENQLFCTWDTNCATGNEHVSCV